jgi:NTP pyrophosphatase (non-canonical NTP hydrolase)
MAEDSSMPDAGQGMLRLASIMRRLRAPEGGCPWDLEQDFESIAPYTIEEAYEVADAIARRDWAGLKGELGDLLFQAVYHAQMAEEAGHFDLSEVIAAISDKMIAGTRMSSAMGPRAAPRRRPRPGRRRRPPSGPRARRPACSTTCRWRCRGSRAR